MVRREVRHIFVCFKFVSSFVSTLHPIGVPFRTCLNNKISSRFSCMYHNLFVSLPTLRIAGNLRKPSERKAKGLTRFVSEVPDVLDYPSSGAFLF